MTRRMSAILGEYSPAGQGCTRHFSVPPLEYKNSTSYKKYRPNFGLNIQESYGKRPILVGTLKKKSFLLHPIITNCDRIWGQNPRTQSRREKVDNYKLGFLAS